MLIENALLLINADSQPSGPKHADHCKAARAHDCLCLCLILALQQIHTSSFHCIASQRSPKMCEIVSQAVLYSVGLLCLKTAPEGGHSQWACSAAIHNEMLRSRPDLYQELLQPLYVDRKDEIPPGKLPYYQMPVFNFHKASPSATVYNLPRLTVQRDAATLQAVHLCICDAI